MRVSFRWCSVAILVLILFDLSRKLSMASLQGSLLVATSILEGAVNACGNVGVSNVGVESVVATGGGGGDVGGGGSSLQATQTLRPLSLISEVQQMMQSQQVCYHSAGGGLGATGRDEFDDDCIDEGHHSPTGHEDRPHSQVRFTYCSSIIDPWASGTLIRNTWTRMQSHFGICSHSY